MNVAEAAMAGIFGSKGSGGGNVSGVKGDAEETYRTGNVNITAANVGAYTKTETDTLLNSKADTTDVDNVKIANTATNTSITITDSADANLQTITVKGRSEEVGEEIVSVGDAGWGVVDLGTLSWTRGETQTSGVYDFYSYELSPLCISNNNTVNGICGKYNDTTIADIYNGTAADKSIAVSNNTIRIRDDNYTDATVFKSALSGVVLYYKLADTTGATPILGIVTNNGAGQGTAATITTGLPLRSTIDGTVYDELSNEKVITRCEVVEGEVIPLATPTETPLTSAEKTALASLCTYDHTTHIDATDTPIMTVDYLLNTNNGKAVAKVDRKTSQAGGLSIKSVSWTGTGETSQTITFPDTPFMILGFTQNPIEDRYTRGLIPFIWNRSNSQLCLCWSDTQSTAPQVNTFQFYSNMRVTISGNTVSWTGSDASQALNQSGTEYTIYYI